MITNIRLGDYKSFGGHAELTFRPLTVLLGKNSSGKTAAARTPLLLLRLLEKLSVSGEVPLQVRGVPFASSTAELAYNGSPHSTIQLGIACAPGPLGPGLVADLEIRLSQSIRGGRRSEVVVHQFEATDRRSRATAGSRVATQQMSNLMHLVSMRRQLQPLFERREIGDLIDPTGAAAPYLLEQNDAVAGVVSEWYETSLGSRLDVKVDGRGFALEASTYRSRANLAHSGQGFQQVLPVATMLAGLTVPSLRLGTLVVEEPELHLHPAVHGSLADLVVQTLERSRGSQVILETHSENLVLRLRRHVASGRLSANDLRILWFDTRNGSSEVQEVLVHDDGNVENWPTGVFSEDLDEVRAISRMQRREN